MLDVNATRTVKIGGRDWAIRPLPFAVLLELQDRESVARVELQRASRVESGSHVPLSDAPEDRAAYQRAIDGVVSADVRSHAEALRWGLRAYADGPRGEDVSVDGRGYRVLSADTVSALVGWGGETMLALAKEVLNREALSAEDLLGFLRPSGS